MGKGMLLFASIFSASLARGVIGANSSVVGAEGPAGCVIEHCAGQLAKCSLNTECRKTLACNAACQSKPNVDGCNLVCELSYGYGNPQYEKVLQCMVAKGCIPLSPMDGKCLATNDQTIKNLTSMAQVAGKWWIVRGLNCGQQGWPGAFDYYPCQRDEFVLENNTWIDHIAYCGGKDNNCTTPIVNTRANASIDSPGVMTHYYLDAPLLPQTEYWRVLSWPHPDWMLYVYCGSTPNGPYAGGSVVSRSARTADAIPPYVEKIFIATAELFGFDYNTMCISNVTSCSD